MLWKGTHKFSRIEVAPGGVSSGFGTPNPPGGVWYVDSNAGNDSYDGLSWKTALKTIAVAGAKAQARTFADKFGWAGRQTIYYAGDNNTEVLLLLPDKTDIIGMGSCDGNDFPVLVGAQLPVAGTVSPYSTARPGSRGTRFINMGFREEAGVCFTVPTTASGIRFIGCTFLGSAAGTTGILATASTDLAIIGCRFTSWHDAGGWSTAAISLGTGTANRTIIEDNIIENAATNGGKGILVNSGRSGHGSYIRNNQIDCTTVCIDDDSNTFYVSGNRGSSEAAEGDTCCDISARLSCDNLFNASDALTAYPIIPKDNFTTTT